MQDRGDAGAAPRDAASLIVIDGERLLMGRRGAGHRFMPNVHVFPGGAVDAEDYAADIATPLPDAAVQAIGDAALARALGVAAARELAEEVGLSLGAPPALDGLAYLCRAITPADRPIRFDARFFVVAADRVSGTLAGSTELEAPGWFSLEQALATDLALATRAVIGQLGRFLAAPATWRAPVLRERAWELPP